MASGHGIMRAARTHHGILDPVATLHTLGAEPLDEVIHLLLQISICGRACDIAQWAGI